MDIFLFTAETQPCLPAGRDRRELISFLLFAERAESKKMHPCRIKK